VIAAICSAVHPASARRRAAAFRKPCALNPFKPASSHVSRNQLPKPAAVKGRPHAQQEGEIVRRRARFNFGALRL
jgi:hypothetical protein